jgi:hypothetical protein
MGAVFRVTNVARLDPRVADEQNPPLLGEQFVHRLLEMLSRRVN